MRYQLDTNAFLWFALDHPRLPLAWRELFSNPANELFVSIVSLWEIVIKVALGKLTVEHPIDEFLQRIETDANITILPISTLHLKILRLLPHHHGDPFDRLIIAQSLAEELTVVTSDTVFKQYDVILF